MAFNLLRYFEGAQPNKKRKESGLIGTQTEKKKKYELEIRDRQFKPHWKNGRSWLFYDEELNTMKCSLCKEHGHPGKISKSWVQGTQNFKIDTVKFHEKSLAHIDAEKSQKNTKNPDQAESFVAIRQLSAANMAHFRFRFRNAHCVAKRDWSFRDYVSICELDRAKGLDTGYSYENDKSCKEFVHHIAMVEADRTTFLLREAKFCSITIDGATDISGEEQESMVVHFCHKGRIHNRFLSFMSPATASSDDIYNSVCSTLVKCQIDIKKVVGTTIDGASNMMGTKKGFTQLMKKTSPDLIATHCLAHRLELAIKDAMKGKEKQKYDRLMTFLLGLYYFYKKSPKQRKLLQKTFDVMKMPTSFPTRAGGTRWVPHTLKAICIFLKSFPVIVTHLQDVSHTVPKAEGLAKMALDVNLFIFMLMLKEVLEPVGSLSLRLQDSCTTLADAYFQVDLALDLLKNYGTENSEELLAVHSTKMFKNVSLRGRIPDLSYREGLVQVIIKALDGRFAAEKEFYESCRIVNFVSWPSLKEKSCIHGFGEKEVKFLQQHFNKRFDDSNLLLQWRMLKKLIYQRYGDSTDEIQSLDWEIVNKALQDHDVDDILSMVDLILSLPPTSVVNERAFSHMKLIKGEKRARMNTETLSEIMLVKLHTTDVPAFNPDEAINRFLMKNPGHGKNYTRRPEYLRNTTKERIDAAGHSGVEDAAAAILLND